VLGGDSWWWGETRSLTLLFIDFEGEAGDSCNDDTTAAANTTAAAQQGFIAYFFIPSVDQCRCQLSIGPTNTVLTMNSSLMKKLCGGSGKLEGGRWNGDWREMLLESVVLAGYLRAPSAEK